MGRKISIVRFLGIFFPLLACLSLAGLSVVFHQQIQDWLCVGQSASKAPTASIPAVQSRAPQLLFRAVADEESDEPPAHLPLDRLISAVLPSEASAADCSLLFGWPLFGPLTEIAVSGMSELPRVAPTRQPEVVPVSHQAPASQRAPASQQAAGMENERHAKQIPLDRPLESPPPLPPEVTRAPAPAPPMDAPLGFTGRSRVVSQDDEDDPHFVPVEDRWRVGFPSWDRYGKNHPRGDDYPYVEGHWWDPFNQNVLKGDFPIVGQDVFLNVTASTRAVIEPREIPTATTPFESTLGPHAAQFFGNPDQLGYSQFFTLAVDLFQGDGAFRPVDWRIKLAPVFNVNVLAAQELAVVNPDVTRGTYRPRTFFALEEWFAEVKLADLSPNYDFLSVRAGAQPFTSDFRGFIFSDVNRGLRFFGTRNANQEQVNVAYFNQQEKDTNSELNTFQDRGQQVVIVNYFIQDFIFPGYTTMASFHYNHDNATFHFDNNDVLVRPDPVGVFQPHRLDVFYVGWAGDGHVDRVNVNHAFYWALGHDSFNPIANSPQEICAEMAALELSYDRDWIRFRSSVLWASGDNNPNNSHATGFDAIFDNPNFAGGEFSYWQRQAVPLLGVNLTNRGSLLPDLRASKIEGQSNFVNPGLFLVNAGMDFDLTPKLRVIANANFLWFDNTSVLRQFVYQQNIAQSIGTDLSLGVEYRPFLNNNVIFKCGVATLIPGEGFHNLYDNLGAPVNSLVAGFMDMALMF